MEDLATAVAFALGIYDPEDAMRTVGIARDQSMTEPSSEIDLGRRVKSDAAFVARRC